MEQNQNREHPFAEYIRILGKGKRGSRPLSRAEAYHAMSMILTDEIEPIQLGAFLMLMRVKEETAEELAGFVQAVRDSLKLQPDLPKADLDWSSYAGKRRHPPWFLLSALLLAENGVRIFMHGATGHTAGRLYTQDVLKFLGIRYATSQDDSIRQLENQNFSYLSLETLCPKLDQMMRLRSLMGLRSPVHTLARMINPLNAPYSIQGIFHPGYRPVHQETGMLLNQPHMAVLKGEGGEIERNPDAPCLVQSIHNGELSDEQWPPYFKKRHLKPDHLDPSLLGALWRGEYEDEFAEATVIGTAAVTLKLLGKTDAQQEAEKLAQEFWQNRNTKKFSGASS